jgi:phosphohistidine phosphatase
MRLILLRHARAEDPRFGQSDHQRALTATGHAQAASVAQQLAGCGWEVELALCSDARRTRETLDAVLGAMPVRTIRYEPRIYTDGPLEPLSELSGDGTVLLVGHNPHIELLLGQLSGDVSGMGTADAALLASGHGGAWRDRLDARWHLVKRLRAE